VTRTDEVVDDMRRRVGTRVAEPLLADKALDDTGGVVDGTVSVQKLA
jgi:hypothetical protein